MRSTRFSDLNSARWSLMVFWLFPNNCAISPRVSFGFPRRISRIWSFVEVFWVLIWVVLINVLEHDLFSYKRCYPNADGMMVLAPVIYPVKKTGSREKYHLIPCKVYHKRNKLCLGTTGNMVELLNSLHFKPQYYNRLKNIWHNSCLFNAVIFDGKKFSLFSKNGRKRQ